MMFVAETAAAPVCVDSILKVFVSRFLSNSEGLWKVERFDGKLGCCIFFELRCRGRVRKCRRRLVVVTGPFEFLGRCLG
jgi:hypothetical protein